MTAAAADVSTRTADDATPTPHVDWQTLESPAGKFDYASPETPSFAPSPTRRLVLPTRETGGTRVAWTLIAIAVAALYFAFLMCYWAPAHPGVDQNGYLVGGRQYSETMSSGMKPESPFAFVGRMWIRTTADDSGVYYPKYPLGLPIYYAANLWLGQKLGFEGVETAELLSPIAAALALLGVFAIVRRLSGGFVGVMAMLLCGLGQTFLTLSVNPNSHAAGTCAVVWGIAFLLGFLERGTVWRGIACGLCLGIAYTIRYTDGLLLLPLGVALLYATRWAIPSLQRALITAGSVLAFVFVAWVVAWCFGGWLVERMGWLTPLTADGGKPYRMLVELLAAGAIVSMFVPWRSLWRLLCVVGAWCIPAGYLTLFNMVAMRSFTSYAGTNESTGFGPDYFFGNWEKMIRVLHDQSLFFIAPIGVLGLLVMARRLPLVAAILTLWFVPSVLLYTAYYWAPDNQGVSYSRFVLTSIPALVISAAWLMGEAAHLRRTANRRGWLRPAWTRGVASAVALFLGAALVYAGLGGTLPTLSWPVTFWSLELSPLRHPTWWLLVPTGGVIALVAAASLLANVGWAARFRESFEWHASGLLPRVSVAAVVFVSCALGGFRSVEGVEGGQRLFARVSVEWASRDNNNLAELGRQLRDAVSRDAKGKRLATPIADDQVILFSEREKAHHLQFAGGWTTFAHDAFTPEAGRAYAAKPAFLVDDPDPIDPNTCEYMRGVYAKFDEKGLVAEQNKLMADALAKGKRVFYVLSKPSAAAFEKRFIAGKPFAARPAGTWVDMPAPRRDEEFLPPEEQPKQPVGGRLGRNVNLPNVKVPIDRLTYRIVEIVSAPAAATQPAAPTPEQQMAARRLAEQQAKAAEAAKAAEVAKAAELAKAEQAKLEKAKAEQARVAEQQARALERQKAAEAARAERLKAAELARATTKPTTAPATRPAALKAAVATTKPATTRPIAATKPAAATTKPAATTAPAATQATR